MKRIGIAGVGEIGRAVVAGLHDGGGDVPEVFLSPQGARTAAALKRSTEPFEGAESRSAPGEAGHHGFRVRLSRVRGAAGRTAHLRSRW